MIKKRIPIIFDTDMELDCDDTGALAILHAFMNLGKANILGIICDVPSRLSVNCIKVINHYYNRDDIPVGQVNENDNELYIEARKKFLVKNPQKYYIKEIAKIFKEKVEDRNTWEDVSLYRYLLSKSEESSIIIVAVGLLTSLNNLLNSKGDKYSPLDGRELVKQKVKMLVTMGIGKYPSSKDVFNWLMNWQAALNVINNWPVKLVVQPNGDQFITGNRLSKQTSKSNPVRICYETYSGGENKGNYSWDPITAFYGVEGNDPFFEEITDYRIVIDEELGKNHWIPDNDKERQHSFLRLKDKFGLKKVLEGLMVAPPKL